MKTLFLIFLILQSACGAKILGVFPTPSISHQVVFHALMKDLAARGHELIILTPDVFETDNPNVTQIDLHSCYETFRREFNFIEFKNGNMDETDLFNYFFPIMMKYLEEQLSHPEVKKLINDKDKHHFDIIIMEVLLNYPMLAFAELFDVPVIEFTSLDTVSDNHRRMGNEANQVIHPELMFPFQQKRLTFAERWQCLKYLVKHHLTQSSKNIEIQNLIRKHFPTVEPNLEKLLSRIEFMMINTHPALGYIRPLVPNTIQLGFMHIEPPKPLSEGPLKYFLDNSKNGVIYMSFGSNVQSKDLSPDVKSIFLNVFKSLNYDVLWKFESDDLPYIPKNLMIRKWLPQADLLAHPKIKLFITQGGQQSMEETIDREVPTIIIPFLGDQDSNAKRMEQKNIGKHLELHSLTEETLKSTIEEMFKPKYKENIKKLRNLIYDHPMSSREKAVWWTEYVIRHKGASHLKYIGTSVPFYEKYFLDFTLLGFIILAVSIKILYNLIKIIFVSSNKRTKVE